MARPVPTDLDPHELNEEINRDLALDVARGIQIFNRDLGGVEGGKPLGA